MCARNVFIVSLSLAGPLGCHKTEPVGFPHVSTTERPPSPGPALELTPFHGEPARPITWDMWGDWTLTRTERKDGQAGKGERFEETWHLQKREDNGILVWYDKTRGETFTLIPGLGKGDRLRWRRYRGRIFDFSVNEQSYGMLVLTDQDGENYLAVRTEGGE